MRLSVEMTLSAETAQRFREVAQRLIEKEPNDDALLAATVLMRIARNYQIAVDKALAAELETEENVESTSSPDSSSTMDVPSLGEVRPTRA